MNSELGYIYCPRFAGELMYGKSYIMNHDIYHDITWWNITRDFLQLVVL